MHPIFGDTRFIFTESGRALPHCDDAVSEGYLVMGTSSGRGHPPMVSGSLRTSNGRRALEDLHPSWDRGDESPVVADGFRAWRPPTHMGQMEPNPGFGKALDPGTSGLSARTNHLDPALSRWVITKHDQVAHNRGAPTLECW